MKQVYFDNAATTQMHEDVIDAMALSMKNNYGNPSQHIVLVGKLSQLLNVLENK